MPPRLVQFRPSPMRSQGSVVTDMAVLVSASLFTLVLGFAAGYFGFKIRTRWCPTHGSALRCPECTATLAAQLTMPGRL